MNKKLVSCLLVSAIVSIVYIRSKRAIKILMSAKQFDVIHGAAFR